MTIINRKYALPATSYCSEEVLCTNASVQGSDAVARHRISMDIVGRSAGIHLFLDITSVMTMRLINSRVPIETQNLNQKRLSGILELISRRISHMEKWIIPRNRALLALLLWLATITNVPVISAEKRTSNEK